MIIPTGTPRCLRIETLVKAKGDYDDYSRVMYGLKFFLGALPEDRVLVATPSVWIVKFKPDFFFSFLFENGIFPGTESLLIKKSVNGSPLVV